jgi:hypothetical protein
MNQVTYRRRLQHLLDRYITFLPIAQQEFMVDDERFRSYLSYKETNPHFKLLDEIQLLRFKIIRIDNMNDYDVYSEIDFREEIISSKLNNQ